MDSFPFERPGNGPRSSPRGGSSTLTMLGPFGVAQISLSVSQTYWVMNLGPPTGHYEHLLEHSSVLLLRLLLLGPPVSVCSGKAPLTPFAGFSSDS